ncbi:MAG: GtrA family protein [Methanoregula sp.]
MTATVWGKNGNTSFFSYICGQKIIGFFLIGIVATLVDFGLLYFFTGYLGIWYLLSAALSYCCGTVTSYTLNKRFIFRDQNSNYLGQFTTFAAISVSCLLVTLCVIWLAVELFSFSYLTAKIIAVVCAFFWNYHGQSRLTFRSDT